MKYSKIINEGNIPAQIFHANLAANYARGIIAHLPYFGYAEKKYINFEKVPEETKEALQNLIDVGLIIDKEHEYCMTSDAWLWDNEIMYYLSPSSAKEELDACFTSKVSEDYYKIADV